MSGGSYDYIGFRISDLKQEIHNQSGDPRRARFAKLMGLVGEAMYKIEWVDSSDCGPGDEHAAIDAVFAFAASYPDAVTKKG